MNYHIVGVVIAISIVGLGVVGDIVGRPPDKLRNQPILEVDSDKVETIHLAKARERHIVEYYWGRRLKEQRLELERAKAEAESFAESESMKQELPVVQEEVFQAQAVYQELSFEDAGRATISGRCSGFFISPTTVITAGHCASSTVIVDHTATGQSFEAVVTSSSREKDFAILTLSYGSIPQARTLWKRELVDGELVTVYSYHSGTYTATVQAVIGDVYVESGSMTINYGAQGSMLGFINVSALGGDSGSLVLGQDGAYLGVISGGHQVNQYLLINDNE